MSVNVTSNTDAVPRKRRVLRAAVVRIGECLLGIPRDAKERAPSQDWWSEPESLLGVDRRVAARVNGGHAVEQSEFWFTDVATGTAKAVSAVPIEEAEDPLPLAWQVPEPETDSSMCMGEPPECELLARTPLPPLPDASPTYAERRRFASMLNVGRFLMLGGALESKPRDGRRFKLPRNPFRPAPQLWNEPDEAGSIDRTLRFPPCDFSSHGPRRADGNLIF